MSFANLKRSSGSSLERLSKMTESMNSPNNYNDDENYWKPTIDKAGNSFSIIRFLPAPETDGDSVAPWCKYYDHGFKGDQTGLWYIEKSLTSIGKPDFLGEWNSQLWNSGIEANRDIARKQKRRLHYVSNIYIIKDPANPENNGKVFLFRYGKKIMEKITGAMNPQFEDDDAFDPFNFWEGANFKLKIRKVDGYTNYDLSEFDKPCPLLDDDDELEKIWKSEFSLKEIVDPKNFKSYEELKTKLEKVLGITGSTSTNTVSAVRNQNILNKEKEVESVFTEEEDDSSLDYFKDLLESDD